MTRSTELLSLSRDEILLLPAIERIPYVEQIRVSYPRSNAILEQIKACHVKQQDAAEPPCLLLVGPTGAGKTKLIESYEQQFPVIRTQRGKQVRVLCGNIPSTATVKTLVTELLAALGDPRATHGTVGELTLRLRSFIKDCGVELLILDELQHFVDRDSRKVLLNVSNWLKALVKDTKIACVLVGLKGEAEEVVSSNPQLARLFGDPYVLDPFQWDRLQPETITEFRMFLTQLEKLLPLREASNLSTGDRAWRCFVASEGLMAHLMKLIRNATAEALRHEQEYLTDEILSRVFQAHLAPKRRRIPDPFVGASPAPPIPQPSAPDSNERATNRRGQSKKPRQKKIKDILN